MFARVSKGYLSKREAFSKRNTDCFYENALSLLHKRSGTKLEKTSLSADVCLCFLRTLFEMTMIGMERAVGVGIQRERERKTKF